MKKFKRKLYQRDPKSMDKLFKHFSRDFLKKLAEPRGTLRNPREPSHKGNLKGTLRNLRRSAPSPRNRGGRAAATNSSRAREKKRSLASRNLGQPCGTFAEPQRQT